MFAGGVLGRQDLGREVRRLEHLLGAYGVLDLTPKGRNEDGLSFTMAWVRHHDRYAAPAETGAR